MRSLRVCNSRTATSAHCSAGHSDGKVSHLKIAAGYSNPRALRNPLPPSRSEPQSATLLAGRRINPRRPAPSPPCPAQRNRRKRTEEVPSTRRSNSAGVQARKGWLTSGRSKTNSARFDGASPLRSNESTSITVGARPRLRRRAAVAAARGQLGSATIKQAPSSGRGSRRPSGSVAGARSNRKTRVHSAKLAAGWA